jgi:hypothetical protein
MNWLNNVLFDLQRKILGGDDQPAADNETVSNLGKTRTNERVQQFQARLHELDRRLAQLR